MVTSRDVARAAGVSQATVSRVVTDASSVSEATRRRVLTAMRDSDYVPHAAAQTMKTGRTHSIGAVVADLTNPFYPQLLQDLSRAFDERGERLTVWTAGSRSDAALQSIRRGLVDGVVFTSVLPDSPEFATAVAAGSPIVLVNRTLDVDCDQVSSDNAAGGALVADHFADHGRRRIAFLGGPQAASTSRERLEGFRVRLAERGISLTEQAVGFSEYTHRDGYQAMVRLLEQPSGPPDAVFCSNDLLAFGAQDAARSRLGDAARQVWIAGYDDVDMSSWESIGLTTVRQDTAALSRIAAELALARLADRHRASERRLLAPQLIVRASARV